MAMQSALRCLRGGAAPGSSARAMSFMTRIADGNLGEQLLNRKGELIGEDANGNKYYENLDYQIGRHRWVVFADQKGYSGTSVTPDWHGWLHHIHDGPPTQRLFLHPAYEVAASNGKYGSAQHAGSTSTSPANTHFPKGHLKAGRKSWTRFQSWEPPQN